MLRMIIERIILRIHIMRFSDVLLMLAELTKDVSYINQVRDRVGLPALEHIRKKHYVMSVDMSYVLKVFVIMICYVGI